MNTEYGKTGHTQLMFWWNKLGYIKLFEGAYPSSCVKNWVSSMNSAGICGKAVKDPKSQDCKWMEYSVHWDMIERGIMGIE